MMTRLAGGPGAAGVAAVAGADSAPGLAADTTPTAAGVVCSTLAVDGMETSADAAGAWLGRDGAAVTAGGCGLASCGTVLAGAATTEDAAVKPDEGGFTITGPEGGLEAIAGVAAGGPETIGGACRG